MKNKKGLTLIGLLVSMMLIVMFIVVICSINIMALRIKVITKKKDEAFNIARGICELFRLEDYEYCDEDLKTLYISVESLDDIESIIGVFKNESMQKNTLSSVIEENKRYVIMLNLSKKQGVAIEKGYIPSTYVLMVKIYIMGEYITTMIQAR